MYDFQKYIAQESASIDWRFKKNRRVLNKVNVFNESFEKIIWSKLKSENFLLEYSLNNDKFEHFETIKFVGNSDSVTKSLKEFSLPNKKIALTWFAEQHTLLTDWKTFTHYWDDFFYPGSDDLIVFDESWNWILYFSHFETLQLGQGIKN